MSPQPAGSLTDRRSQAAIIQCTLLKNIILNSTAMYCRVYTLQCSQLMYTTFFSKCNKCISTYGTVLDDCMWQETNGTVNYSYFQYKKHVLNLAPCDTPHRAKIEREEKAAILTWTDALNHCNKNHLWSDSPKWNTWSVLWFSVVFQSSRTSQGQVLEVIILQSIVLHCTVVQ